MSGNQVDQLLNDVGWYEGDIKTGNIMVKEFTVILMDQSMKENGRMGKNTVKGY